MKMNNMSFDELIKSSFPDKAWVYAEGLDSIRIGKWNGSEFNFAESFDETYIIEMRVFNSKHELKITGEKHRDTANYNDNNFISELADDQYFMYGEQAAEQGENTVLYETRGGAIVFPGKLEFPKTDKLPDGVIGLKLGVRNYVRYNRVPVLTEGESYDFDLNTSGAGAIEVVDYAYTGFFYANGTAVKL